MVAAPGQTRRRDSRRSILLLWISLTIVGVLIVIPSLRSVVHESDQAAILHGGWALAKGHAGLVHPGFYNYDKLFVTYWLLALAFRVVGFIHSTPDFVAIGNVLSASLFYFAVAALLAKKAQRLEWGPVFCTLLAPAILVHGPFLAAAFVSGAFLIWLYLDLSRRSRRTPWHLLSIAVLSFAAVGSRADAVLALPIVCWLTLGPTLSLWRFLTRPSLWAALVGAVAAIVLGKLIGEMHGVVAFAPIFVPKVIAAYTVTGLGGAIILLGWIMGWLAKEALLKRRWQFALALPMLLLPSAYYCFQLFSPRYWTLQILVVLLVLCSRPWQARRRLALQAPTAWDRVLRGTALATTLIPLLIGLSLPVTNHPRLTFTKPTYFPSSDGLIPIGAYAWHMFGEHARIPDHIQAIWLASLQADFRPEANGSIPIAYSPMFEVVRFACESRGMHPKLTAAGPEHPVVYIDLRSLIKVVGGLDTNMAMDYLEGDLLANGAVSEVSPRVEGTCIASVNIRDRESTRGDIWRAGRSVFHGSDFQLRRLSAAGRSSIPLRLPLGEGKKIGVFSKSPFVLVGEGKAGKHSWQATLTSARLGYYAAEIPGAFLDLDEVEIVSAGQAEFEVAHASLPDYMFIRPESEK